VLVDDVGLWWCTQLWHSRRREKVMFLMGRFLFPNWDIDERLQGEGEMVEKDLLEAPLSLV
jgi:hypothetical protein